MSPAAASAAPRGPSNDSVTKESLMGSHQAQAGDSRLQRCQQSNIETAIAIKRQMQQVLAGGAPLDIDLSALLAAHLQRHGAQG